MGHAHGPKKNALKEMAGFAGQDASKLKDIVVLLQDVVIVIMQVLVL